MPSLHNTLHTTLIFGRRVRKLAEALSSLIPEGSRVLDVGCGDGQISAQVVARRQNVSLVGIDVLLRPERALTVTLFDGARIPFEDESFDLVMFVDVLHHSEDPTGLLAEAARVSKKYLLIKDHVRTGFIGKWTLRLMDWFGNAQHNVVLPYNYLAEPEWEEAYRSVGLAPIKTLRKLELYPNPANWIFGRGLHFITLLAKKAGMPSS